MSKKNQLLAYTLHEMLEETTNIVNFGKKFLNDIEYENHYIMKSDDQFNCIGIVKYQDKKIMEISEPFKFLKSSKLTNIQSKDFSRIEKNISMLIFINTELRKIWTKQVARLHLGKDQKNL